MPLFDTYSEMSGQLQREEAVSYRETVNGPELDCIPHTYHYSGPNQVLPTDKLHTVLPHGRVKLRMQEDGMAALRPMSVPGMLDKIARNYPNIVALAHKGAGNTWQHITYKDYRTAVRTCSKAFLKLGLKRYHSVCILGFNSPGWFISDLAAIHAGGFVAGIYTTNSPEACHYCAETSRANIIVVEDQKQLDKILQIRERLPELKAIIQYTGTPPDTPEIYSWENVMKIGREESDEELEHVLKTIAINECCTLVFTSGTVGNPKAVMLSHDNMTYTANMVTEYFHLLPDTGETFVSYLPLSHITAQCVDIYTSILSACTVYFADKDALKAYGMSETTAAHSASLEDTFRLASVGKGLPGTKTKIYNPGQDQQGEVCIWGRHVFMGYLNDELNTYESLDEEGWLHSGDIGQLDEEGFLYITGRIKELLITAGGENIPPVIIEDAIKVELPFLSNVILIGNQRKFLSVLLTFKTNINMETGEALDEVTSEVKDWLTSLGSKASTVSQILEENSDKVMEAIQQGIDRANAKAISNAQKVKKYSILAKDFSILSGELGICDGENVDTKVKSMYYGENEINLN